MLQASTPWGELGLASHRACSPWMTCVHMYLGETPHTTQGTRLRIGSPRVSSAHPAAAAGRLHGCGRYAARARAGGRRLRDWRAHRRCQPLRPAGARRGARRPPRRSSAAVLGTWPAVPPPQCWAPGATLLQELASMWHHWQKSCVAIKSDDQPYVAEMRDRPVQGLAGPAHHACTVVLVEFLSTVASSARP